MEVCDQRALPAMRRQRKRAHLQVEASFTSSHNTIRVRLEMHGPAAGGKMARFSSRQISLNSSQTVANAFFAIPGGAAAFLDGSMVASLLGADAATVVDQRHISLQAIMRNLQSGVEATVCKWWSLPAASSSTDTHLALP